MSLVTPNNPRMINSPWALRLTPSNSPYTRNSVVRSPIKSGRQDLGLSLKQVIGTTTVSSNGFDSLPIARSFAFTAGAAAVITTVDDDNQITQRFFRARPTAAPLNPSTSIYGPSTPTNSSIDVRTRTVASLRESSLGTSPFGSPIGEWGDSPGNKTWTARERVKAATCVAFSRDGKYLAVGETGYKPRVLVFATSQDAPSDIPLSSISDHTFGVKCIAFSPDSQYLASLGNTNDGFLYIWSINSRNGSTSLHASNKCTSNVLHMAWLGNNLITVGTRHVKIWRVEDMNRPSPSKGRQSDVNGILASPTNRTLPGRNCLLGALLEASFTSIVAVTSSKAIVSTESGEICILDDSEGTQRLTKIRDVGFGVVSMTLDLQNRLHIAGADKNFVSIAVADLITTQAPPHSPALSSLTAVVKVANIENSVVAMGPLNDSLAVLDGRHGIHLLQLTEVSEESSNEVAGLKLCAHGDAVSGVQPLSSSNIFNASFFTWSVDGVVLFWNHEGFCKGNITVPLEQIEGSADEVNELKVVRASIGVKFLVSGDKYGVLRIINGESKETIFEAKAHVGEITDVAIYEGARTFVACAGRDRMVQVFERKAENWNLLQTLDEHVGSVTGLLFSPNGDRLLSSSSDRTVVMREFVSREEDGMSFQAFLILRTITLKSSPISMVLDTDRDEALIVSTVDRNVHLYDLRNGRIINSFKVSDTEGGDPVVLSGLATIPLPARASILAGISSTDKSVRLYDDNGNLVCRDWGHTEGISGIALLTATEGPDESYSKRILVTVAVDGTIFVWNVDSRLPVQGDLSKSMDLLNLTPTNKDTIVNKPPLRRVLSHSEMARFQRSSTEDEMSTPTGSRSPRIRKRASKFSLAQAPKLEPSPMPTFRGNFTAEPSNRKPRNRSPSPPSPRNMQMSKSRRPSIDVRSRTKSSGDISSTGFGSLYSSTEQVCRTLKAYRKKLANSSDLLSIDMLRELERELGLTARAVGERAAKSKGVDEKMISNILEQYSERLVEMLDEKISASVARQVRQNSESGTGTPGEERSSESNSVAEATAGTESIVTPKGT
ncbi:WD40 repeat-like protein [Patellaria atrata CBS 101060]|uniref:WD40 repeat-like protein n=1 Tax=Patellaria atrata CBS 101060 TaxID=1346257 RepID=A0A9P4SBF8_9PEZI|nr:WD40 repeat-like protein [Patellaria atrata CBS 101060]